MTESMFGMIAYITRIPKMRSCTAPKDKKIPISDGIFLWRYFIDVMHSGVDVGVTEGNMHSDEYRRLHAACIAMAAQSGSPDAKARWLTLADACSGLAKGLRDDAGVRERARRALRSGPSSATLRAA
jgi:hypothetical protein